MYRARASFSLASCARFSLALAQQIRKKGKIKETFPFPPPPREKKSLDPNACGVVRRAVATSIDSCAQISDPPFFSPSLQPFSTANFETGFHDRLSIERNSSCNCCFPVFLLSTLVGNATFMCAQICFVDCSSFFSLSISFSSPSL